MKKLRWQLLVVLLALSVIAVLLVSQQSTAVPGTVPEIQPTSGGVYTEALIGTFGRLNPLLDHYNSADQDIDRLLFSRLIQHDDRGMPKGDLAETWAISRDGKVFTFSLRSNAKWHDGEPVTAEDVVFTVELMRNDQLPFPSDIREFWKLVDVSALDDTAVKFTLPEAFAPFIDYLSFGILPKHLLENVSAETIIDAPFNLKPVGSGPYRFDRLIIEDGQIAGAALKVNSEYYQQSAYIEQLVFRYYPDGISAFEAYQKGDVMGISQVDAEILPQVFKEADLKLYTARLPKMALVYLNVSDADLPFLQSASIRQALLMGINRQRIIDRLLNGQAILADGPIFPESWAFYEGIDRYQYDPAGAAELIKKAGYILPAEGGEVREKDGVALAFELVYPDAAVYTAIAQEIQAGWKDIGARVDIKPVSYDDLVKNYLEPRTFQAVLVDLNMEGLVDPDPYPFWHQAQKASGQNYSQWDDRLVSEYLEQARVQVDYDERARLYRNFQARFASEMPALPLYYPVYSMAVDAQIQGVRMGPLYDISDRLSTITSWFVNAKRAAPSTPVSTSIN